MQKFKWLLFDVDNTLLDFSSACKAAFVKLFEDDGRDFKEDAYKLYKKINGQVWHDFEDGKIDAITLRRRRFEMFYDAFDGSKIDGLSYNSQYIKNMVSQSMLFPGVENLLEDLKQNYQLAIITNGLKEAQRNRLRKTNIDIHFKEIIVSDEIGVAKPDKAFFDYTIEKAQITCEPSEVLVIGDNIKSDILGGINAGLQTCWISHDNANDSDIIPHYTVSSVLDVHQILL